MHVEHVEALWVAATPIGTAVGAVVAFFIATESGDNDPSPVVNRGDAENEPWGGAPRPVRKYRLPGTTDVTLRSDDALRTDTAVFARVDDTGR